MYTHIHRGAFYSMVFSSACTYSYIPPLSVPAIHILYRYTRQCTQGTTHQCVNVLHAASYIFAEVLHAVASMWVHGVFCWLLWKLSCAIDIHPTSASHHLWLVLPWSSAHSNHTEHSWVDEPWTAGRGTESNKLKCMNNLMNFHLAHYYTVYYSILQ